MNGLRESEFVSARMSVFASMCWGWGGEVCECDGEEGEGAWWQELEFALYPRTLTC